MLWYHYPTSRARYVGSARRNRRKTRHNACYLPCDLQYQYIQNSKLLARYCGQVEGGDAGRYGKFYTNANSKLGWKPHIFIHYPLQSEVTCLLPGSCAVLILLYLY